MDVDVEDGSLAFQEKTRLGLLHCMMTCAWQSDQVLVGDMRNAQFPWRPLLVM